jgi:hypothetical protein
MSSTLANYLSRKLLGQRVHDIDLPNESGKTDPRLAVPQRTGQLRKAWSFAKDVVEETNDSGPEKWRRIAKRAIAREKSSR